MFHNLRKTSAQSIFYDPSHFPSAIKSVDNASLRAASFDCIRFIPTNRIKASSDGWRGDSATNQGTRISQSTSSDALKLPCAFH